MVTTRSVTSYGARCYSIRGTLLQHTGHVVTAYGARCYIKERVDRKASLVHVTLVTLIGLYTFVHIIHSVHNNVGVHSFIY